MLFKLVLLLTLVPLAELLLLLEVTRWTGSVLLTIGIIIATGVLGAALARAEGLRVVRQLQSRLQRGELPADDIIEGVMILVAGALLITPGLMTDAAGFLLLIPPTRKALREAVKRWVRRKVERGEIHVVNRGGFKPIQQQPPPGSPPLEDEE